MSLQNDTMPASEKTQVPEVEESVKRNYTVKDNDRQRILRKSSTVFIEISLSFIKASEKSGKLRSQKAKAYIKEILHSIFFLGYISSPSIHPSDIMGENITLRLEKIYPDVFEGYRTKLPLRPPYSILLDVVVETKGSQRVPEILQELLKLNEAMTVPNDDGGKYENVFCFASTVGSQKLIGSMGTVPNVRL
ncbi:hypothetical protein MATL_G00218730 [Megalops atlanticus]|uniref:Uncharacterized protein n=1 Tax=Megalops atlanticus TaxID=7932 RepID=A0A9D3PJ81_MEGAT|nr:hypothetical protein MATL_G00218730 [Megalops atlanticus]